MAGMMGAAMTAVPAAAQAPRLSLQALDQLEAGLWQIDVHGKPPKLLCVTDPTAFIQLAHAGLACSRFVIANGPRQAIVHYSCNTAGWGRTTVSATTPRAAQIDTQGIIAKAPFQYSAEARKLGACAAPPGAGK